MPTPLCVGLGRAAAIAGAEMAEEAERLRRHRDHLLRDLSRRIPGLTLNGDAERRLPGSLNLTIPGIPAPDLIEATPSVAISTGSAQRFIGMRARICALRAGSSRAPFERFVTTHPGATAFTRMPSAAYAAASDIVRLRTAPFDVE